MDRRWSSLVAALLLVAASAGCPDPGAGGGDAGKAADAGMALPPAPPFAAEVVVRRLSRAELDNTLRDLVGDDSRPAARLLAEEPHTPYDNDYTLQAPSQALIESLEVLAEDVARRALLDPERRATLVPCVPTGAGDEACFRRFVSDFGRRALRRPLADDEVSAYVGLLAYATEENPHVDNDFFTAVELAVRALLLDPELLYRVETGAPTQTPGVYRLGGHEIASRMSYLLWGSLPDEALFDDAAEGRLDGGAGRRAAAERMLDDERARAQLHRFHAMWLGYRAIPHAPELAVAFRRETAALLDRVIFDEGASYLEVFRREETFVDDLLADHYGLPRPQGGEGWVPYGESGRAGILSHGSVLSAFNKFSDTSPTQRGIFVKTRLLCEEIAPPPPEVDVDQPPGDGSAVCKEDRYREHTQSASCAACHGLIDPIGFGLERYDMAGRYRTHDDGRPECAISGEGTLPGYGSFSGPGELAAALTSSGLLEACFLQHYASFALGRPLVEDDLPLYQSLVDAFGRNEGDVKALLTELVASEAFAYRKEAAP